jgi:HAD superfamily hydrolase (TIGR01484 family)
MSIRMIAIDLDGTLLHDDMTISSYSRDVIKKASEEGFKGVIATGRMWNSARKKMEVLELGNVPVVCYTGA